MDRPTSISGGKSYEIPGSRPGRDGGNTVGEMVVRVSSGLRTDLDGIASANSLRRHFSRVTQSYNLLTIVANDIKNLLGFSNGRFRQYHFWLRL